MRYVPSEFYGFEHGTAKYNPMGIKVVLEKLWSCGAFYYNKSDKIDIIVTLTASRKRGHLVNPEEQVIFDQLNAIGQLLGYVGMWWFYSIFSFTILHVVEKTEDEDLTIIDYAIQKSAGLFDHLFII